MALDREAELRRGENTVKWTIEKDEVWVLLIVALLSLVLPGWVILLLALLPLLLLFLL